MTRTAVDSPALEPSSSRHDLPAWLWLLMPLVFLATAFAVAVADASAYNRWFEGELAVVELLTPALTLIGVGCCLAARRWVPQVEGRGVRIWLALFVAGGIYYAGEELSWGQHLFGWQTPDALMVDELSETNVHNRGYLFNEGPRWVVRVAVVGGGLLAPALVLLGGASRRPVAGGDRWSLRRWIWPTHVCMPASALVLLSMMADDYPPALPGEAGRSDIRYAELEELWIATFMMLYAVSLYRRLRAEGGGAAPGGTG